MKAAVYCGTRNLYSDMITAAKSLAIHSSVDVIYFLIEDSKFPERLPDFIQCLDASEQKYFRKNGPNVYKLWTWMVLMRAALSKIFPELDQILSLDVDTIVNHNIDELWELQLDNVYLAGVSEPIKSTRFAPYVNAGVVMFNLKKLREDRMDDKIIRSLNLDKYSFAEQDCINKLCSGHILIIPSIYNANRYTEQCEDPKIIHFAAEKDWNNFSIVQEYRALSWDEIR